MTALTLPTTPADALHRTTPLHAVAPGELLVHEIYLSVQGESTYAGLPCVFVRTSVCDLRCSWCDTAHAFNRGERMTRAAVLAAVLAFDCPLVEVTGGEPLLQAEVYPLMAELADAGKTVLLETSGAHDVSRVDPRVEVRPVVAGFFAAVRALQVHHDHDARIDPAHVVRAAGFEQDRLPRVRQLHHQRVDLGLQQRFAAGHLDEWAVER